MKIKGKLTCFDFRDLPKGSYELKDYIAVFNRYGVYYEYEGGILKVSGLTIYALFSPIGREKIFNRRMKCC